MIFTGSCQGCFLREFEKHVDNNVFVPLIFILRVNFTYFSLSMVMCSNESETFFKMKFKPI